MTSEEKDTVWKFRFYLSAYKNVCDVCRVLKNALTVFNFVVFVMQALSKFLKSVNWNLAQEAQQALDMLRAWAPLEPEDALELLTSSFTQPAVRKYAVQRLAHADNEVSPDLKP